MSRFAGLYTVQETARIAHLSPRSLQNYARGHSDLVRGADFLIRREGTLCRRLYFTERGIQRLTTRSYRTYRHGVVLRVAIPTVLAIPTRHVADGRPLYRRYRALILQVLDLYSKSPCAMPDCPCISHKLGLPRLDEMLQAVQMQQDKHASYDQRRRKSDSMGG